MGHSVQIFSKNSYLSVFRYSLYSLLVTIFVPLEMASGSETASKVKLEGKVSHFHSDEVKNVQQDGDLSELEADMKHFQVRNKNGIHLDEDLLELNEDIANFQPIKVRNLKLDKDLQNLHQDVTDRVNLNGALEKESLELKIKWDKWRNRVAKKLWKRFNTLLVGGDAFYLGPLLLKYGEAEAVEIPLGAKTHYSYQITRDKRIVNARIEKSSGYRKMDDLILNSLSSMNRKGYLRFPVDSQRQVVTMRGNMEISRYGGFEKIDYGDIETITVPH